MQEGWEGREAKGSAQREEGLSRWGEEAQQASSWLQSERPDRARALGAESAHKKGCWALLCVVLIATGS